MSSNLQQRILDVFRKFGEPCTRAEAIEMLAEPDVSRADFGSRLANLVRYGHVAATLGKDGVTRYQFASATSRKGREAGQVCARGEGCAGSAGEAQIHPQTPRDRHRGAVASDSIQVESDHDHAELQIAATIKLAAETARELAVIALTNPRPLSDRVRKAVLDLVRIAA